MRDDREEDCHVLEHAKLRNLALFGDIKGLWNAGFVNSQNKMRIKTVLEFLGLNRRKFFFFFFFFFLTSCSVVGILAVYI